MQRGDLKCDCKEKSDKPNWELGPAMYIDTFEFQYAVACNDCGKVVGTVHPTGAHLLRL